MNNNRQTLTHEAVLNQLRQRHDRLGQLACDSLALLEGMEPAFDRLSERKEPAAASTALAAAQQPGAVAA